MQKHTVELGQKQQDELGMGTAHCVINRNETADVLAKQGPETAFIGPKPRFCVSNGLAL